MFRFCVGKLEDAVRLTQERRIEIAEELYEDAKMHDDSPAEAEQFLSRLGVFEAETYITRAYGNGREWRLRAEHVWSWRG